MSRTGNSPILMPPIVTMEIEGRRVTVKGPLGELKLDTAAEVKVEIEEGEEIGGGKYAKVARKKDDPFSRSIHGLTRALLANMVIGVEKGWQKKLELVGVGFRVQGSEDKLTMTVGFSHPVEIQAPEGIKFKIEDNTKIIVSGIDRALVGQTAASIRKVRPPEPYQGKGIRYAGEYVRRKAGKAGKVGSK
ncbi:MAG: 50S ribosomal protein L6 [Armatimonadetes bacterium]|nr:MAG: 50S ribosomal protein L6 [Armatimonadota bacterium]